MNAPKSHYLQVDRLEFHYVEWGEPHNPPLILWHGFARTCRDFDELAGSLASNWHIFAPDTIGRGFSQWSPDPHRDYNNDRFASLAASFLDGLGVGVVDWVGTSMGGGIAIRAGATTLKGRIRRLVLNDIGPEINRVAVNRIRTYASNPPAFTLISNLEAYFRQIYAPFGHLTDTEWRRLTETSTRRLPDGRVTPHYDPKIVVQFTDNPDDYAQWPFWDALEANVLCLRGEKSDLLLAPAADAMTTRGPPCRLVTVPGVGHAPPLNVADQINLVSNFLADR